MAEQQQNYFTKAFNNFVRKMPYSGNATVIDNIQELNPKFETFWKIGSTQQERNLKQAISVVQDPNNPTNNLEGIIIDKGYHDYLYALIDTDKAKRIADYRIMASYAEISHALDEICDEALVKDEKGGYATVNIAERFDDVVKKELLKNFNHIVELFNLDNRGWEYFRTLLIDAEVFFENVINEEKKEAGIISVVQIPTEHINPIFDNVQNMIIKGYILRKPVPKDDKSGGYNINNRGPSGGPVKDGLELIPLERHQVTYFHSHTWNENKTIRLPYIEVARRAYKQLSLIEDSIVVYRLVRAPERLAFYVDVGNMPAPKAEAYLKRLMQSYWSRKTYDSAQGKNINVYDPQSMLDSYWFAKRAGDQGTKVEMLKGGSNLGQLDDLNYFVKKLYKALRVPTSRLNPDTKFADGSEILREELKFAKLIIRLQRHFAATVKDTYITHLKLKGLWQEYKLKESDISITFNPPSHFHAIRDQQLLDIKIKNFNGFTQVDNISKTYALKKFINWSDDEIKANREWLKKDAALAWEIDKITTLGSNWKEAMTTGAAQQGGPGMPGGAGGIGPGAGAAPSFGPGPGGEAEPGAAAAPEMPGAPGATPGLAPAPGAGPQPGGAGSALPAA